MRLNGGPGTRINTGAYRPELRSSASMSAVQLSVIAVARLDAAYSGDFDLGHRSTMPSVCCRHQLRFDQTDRLKTDVLLRAE